MDFSYCPNPPSELEKYGIFQHLSVNASICLIYIQWDLNTGLTSNETMLAVWISLVWVDRRNELHSTG